MPPFGKCRANLILVGDKIHHPGASNGHPQKACVALAFGAAEADGQGRTVHGALWWFEDSPHLETKQSI